MANSVLAINTSSETAKIVVLTTHDVLGQAQIFVLDEKTGRMTRAPMDVPLTADLAAGLEMGQLRSALQVSSATDNEIFFALGDANSDVTRTSLSSPQGIEHKVIRNFNLSARSLNSASGESRVYLGGQSGSEAALAVVSLSQGGIVDTLKFGIEQSKLVDEEASVSQLVRDDNLLVGTTSVQNLAEESTQIGLWSVKLDTSGLPSIGSVFKAYLVAGDVEVTSILPISKEQKVHLVIQNAENEQIYAIFDLVTGTMKNALSFNSLPQGPFMTLLADMDSYV